MKNIGFLHGRYPFGGGEKMTSSIAPYLKAMGYNIFVFSSKINHKDIPLSDREHITFVDIGKTRLLSRPKVRLLDKVKELDIQILVFVGKAFSATMEGIFKHTSCKCIFAHCGMTFWQSENLLAELNDKAKKNPFSWLYYKGFQIPKYHFRRKIKTEKYRLIYNRYDAMVMLCDAYRDELIQALGIVENHKVIAISSPVEAPSEAPNLDKKKQLLYVGRMSYVDKRVDRLISIWNELYQKFPDWEFVLVGTGEELPKLKEEAERLQLSRIHFKGRAENTQPYYEEAAIFCLTSQIEGLGIVLMEAQQSGVIPVAFDCSAGVRELLSPSGTNGILVPSFDMKAYVSQLEILMQEEVLRKQMQKSGIEKAKSMKSDVIAEKWAEVFEKLLHNQPIC